MILYKKGQSSAEVTPLQEAKKASEDAISREQAYSKARSDIKDGKVMAEASMYNTVKDLPKYLHAWTRGQWALDSLDKVVLDDKLKDLVKRIEGAATLNSRLTN